jgi:hypothetical protein
MSWTTRLVPGWKLMVTDKQGYFDVLFTRESTKTERRLCGQFPDVSVCHDVCEHHAGKFKTISNVSAL